MKVPLWEQDGARYAMTAEGRLVAAAKAAARGEEAKRPAEEMPKGAAKGKSKAAAKEKPDAKRQKR